mgnify:CR=1 FL=1
MLRGPRVVLRAVTRDDLARKAQFANDPDYHVLLDDDPWEPESLEAIEARYDERLETPGGGDNVAFAIEADGQYIGQCSLFRFDRM